MRRIRLHLLFLAVFLIAISFPLFAQEERILIVSPHPDDETLACGGYIAKKAAQKADIMVIEMTNGDGFTYSAELEFKKLTLHSGEYISYAYSRQQEAIDALEILGLSSDGVSFLGYPDRGLESLWFTNWPYDKLYTSPYTKVSDSPYTSSYECNAPYCGLNVIKNLEEIFTFYKPTAIYVTNPYDKHSDHWATFCFTSLALEDLKLKGESFAGETKVYTYLIHYPKWPPTRGIQKDMKILPPPSLVGLDMEWIEEPLNAEEEEAKYQAILKYNSQLKSIKKLMLSSVRVNELFCLYPPVILQQVPNGSIIIDGEKDDWGALQPVILQPQNESFITSMEGGGDIAAIYSCMDSENLYIRIDTRKKPNNSVYFDIFLHAVTGKDMPVPYKIRIKPSENIVSDLDFSKDDFKAAKVCELKIPLKLLENPEAVFIGVESSTFLFKIEKSSSRMLELVK